MFIARFLQARLERISGRELDATRIRQLDAVWITAGVVVVLIADAAVALLS